MNGGSFAKRHLRGHFTIAAASALPMLFKKFGQLRFGYAEVGCLKRLPNLFAARESSGIVAAGFMANEILKPRSFPCFRRFALFHKADRRIAP